MKTCLLLGDRSDIAKGLEPLLINDGWRIYGWNRDSVRDPRDDVVTWDLLLSCLGSVAPVGNWWEADELEFARCVESNVLLPQRMLAQLWDRRAPNASVCFMGGSNPQKIMPGYLPYNMSKMALLKAVEQMDAESPDTKIFALGPGYVKTKIHKATLEANWPNERIARGDAGTPIETIYECLKWCLDQKKEVCGGRNICASDPFGPQLAALLEANPSMYKLRRVE